MVGNRITFDAMEDMIGKTIAHAQYGLEEPSNEAHGPEMLIVYFTDGSSVSITIGSNAYSLSCNFKGLEPR